MIKILKVHWSIHLFIIICCISIFAIGSAQEDTAGVIETLDQEYIGFVKYQGENFPDAEIKYMMKDNRDYIYAVTGPWDASVFRSKDDGSSWEYLGLKGSRIRQIKAAENGYIFALNESGILYRSRDDGLHWDTLKINMTDFLVSFPSMGNFYSSLSVNTQGNLFLGTFDNQLTMSISYRPGSGPPPVVNMGIFRSNDFGESWKNIGLKGEVINCIEINAKDEIFVGVDDHGIFCSKDKGKSWQNIGLEDCDVNSLKIYADGHIYAAGSSQTIYYSTDNGDTWNSAYHPGYWCTRDAHGALISIDSYAIYRSLDNGQTWDEMSTRGISYSRALLFNSKGELLIGRDGGIMKIKKGRWQIRLKDIYVTTFATNTKGDFYAGTYDGKGVYFSRDKGDSWQNTGLQGENILSLAINTSDYIFAGTGTAVYRSTDYGQNWQKTELKGKKFRSIAINSNGELFTAAGDKNGIFKSADNGTSWTNCGLNDDKVLTITITPDNDIFASTSGSGGLYHSADNGRSWQNRGLMGENIYSILFDSNGGILAGGASGIYRSTDGGESWDIVSRGNGFPLALNDTGELVITNSGIIFTPKYSLELYYNGIHYGTNITFIKFSDQGDIIVGSQYGILMRSLSNNE